MMLGIGISPEGPDPEWFKLRQGPPRPSEAIYEKLHPSGHTPPIDSMLLRLAGGVNYVGNVDELSGTIEGHGVGVFTSQSYSYAGNWKGGSFGSRGRLQWYDGYTYTGDLERGVCQGTGTIKFPNGDVYEGDIKNGMREGKGTMKSRGSRYEGDWRAGKKHGHGKCFYLDGSVYDGEWEDDARSGKGELKYASGSVYIGDFVAGRKDGKGRMVWRRDGDAVCEYTGEWVSGEPDGEGTYLYFTPQAAGGKDEEGKGGSKKTGSPKSPKSPKSPTSPKDKELFKPPKSPTSPFDSGLADVKQPSEKPVSKYQGRFARGQRNGFGTFFYSDGGVYEGQWLMNERRGMGRQTFSNGGCFIGDYVYGRPRDFMVDLDDEDNAAKVPLFVDDLLVAERRGEKEVLQLLNSAVSRCSVGLRKLYNHYADVQVDNNSLWVPDSAGSEMSMLQFWKFTHDIKLGLSLAAVDRVFLRFGDTTQTTVKTVHLDPLPDTAPGLTPTHSAPQTGRHSSGKGVLPPLMNAPMRTEGSDPAIQPGKLGSHLPEHVAARISSFGAMLSDSQAPSATSTAYMKRNMSSASAVTNGTVAMSPNLKGLNPGSALTQPVTSPSHAGTQQSKTGSQAGGGTSRRGTPPEEEVHRASQESPALGGIPGLGGIAPRGGTDVGGTGTGPGSSITGGTSRTDMSTFKTRPPDKWSRWRKEQHRCDQRIGFREFIEALVRLSAEKYRPSHHLNLSQKFEAFIRDHIWPFAGGTDAAVLLSDAFEVSKVASLHEPTLTQLFHRYSGICDGGLDLYRAKDSSDPTLTVRQFLILLRDFGLLGKVELPVRRALDFFKEEDKDQWVCPLNPMLPAHHEPFVAAPPEPDRKMPQRDTAGHPSSLLGGPRGGARLNSFRQNSFLSRTSNQGGGTRRSFVSNVGGTSKQQRASAASPSRPGSTISAMSRTADSRSDISAIPKSPCSLHQGGPRAIGGHHNQQQSRCSIAQTFCSTNSSKLPTRVLNRQTWLQQNILGGKSCPEVLADRQLVYLEFIDALAKVAKSRIPVSSDCVTLASRFDKLLRERFSSQPE
eukprot:Hpha_TRINITY_DN15092_c0_g5::TRINITY_DN15092_c0_g5_i2::g.124513::m.124513